MKPTAKDIRASHFVLIGIFITLFLQLIAHYQLIHCLFYGTSEVTNIYRGFAWAPLFLVVLRHPLFVINNLRRFPKYWSSLICFFSLMTVLGLVVGFFNYQELRYFFGDLLRFVVPWIALFYASLASRLLAEHRGIKALVPYLLFLTWLAAMDAGITLFLGLKGLGNHISTYLFVFLVPWGLLWNFSGGAIRAIPLSAFFTTMALVATIVSSKRTNFLVFGASIALSLLMLAVFRDFGSKLRVLLGAGILATLLMTFPLAQSGRFVDVLILNASENIRQITTVLMGDHKDNSWLFRENEVANVVDYYESERGLYNKIIGIGFGGEVPMPHFCGDNTLSGQMHHVHKTFWLYYLRHGYIGIIMLALFSLLVIVVPLIQLFIFKSNTATIVWIYASCRCLSAFSGNIMMEEVDIPLCAALTIGCLRASQLKISMHRKIPMPISDLSV